MNVCVGRMFGYFGSDLEDNLLLPVIGLLWKAVLLLTPIRYTVLIYPRPLKAWTYHHQEILAIGPPLQHF